MKKIPPQVLGVPLLPLGQFYKIFEPLIQKYESIKNIFQLTNF